MRTNKRPLPGRGISPRSGGPKRPDVLVKRLSGYEFGIGGVKRGAMEPAAMAEGEKRGEKTHAHKPVEGSDITDNLQSSGPVSNIRCPGGAAGAGPGAVLSP